MADEKQKREYGIPVGGVVLLFLGVIFLLQTLNVIPWGLWGTLWQYWPVILIVIGLGILLRHYNVWLMSLIILAALFACLGLAIWQYTPSPTTSTVTESYSRPLDNLERAQVKMDFPVGDFSIASLPASSQNLVEAGFEKSGGVLRTDFRRDGNTGMLDLRLERDSGPFWNSGDASWSALFSRNIPLTMDVKSAVSNLDVDLSELNVTDLKIKLDVGNYKVTLPASAGKTIVNIDSALSNLDIFVPEGVALKLKAKADLASAEIDQSRFPKEGDYYISPDFNTAKNRIEMEFKGSLGRVSVK